MVEVTPSKKEIVDLVEAQANSIDSISERLFEVESLVEKQDTKNQNITIGALIALVLVVVTVAVEVVLSNKKDAQFYSQLEKDIYDQNLKVQDLNNQFDNLKVRNWLK